MGRRDRRYDGGPEFPLEKVRACIAVSQFALSRKAEYTDGPRILPGGTIDVFGTVKGLVSELREDDWKFAQEMNGRWVDVYRVNYEGRDVWLKLKVELWQHAKEHAVVISFHEWDDDRPI